MIRLLLTYCFLIISTALLAQAEVLIEDIVITGNKKTRDRVILRELTFKKGESIPQEKLQAEIDQSQKNVLNTNLFVKAEINVKDWSDEQSLVLTIEVVENWYLYPYPIFELADRNFNVWWQEQNHSFKRVNYGIRVSYLNPTGNADKLKLTIQDGYTKKYELDYFVPGLNKAQTLGFFANVFFARRKEIAYITSENKLLFDGFEEQFQLSRFRIGGGLSYRPGLYVYHSAKLIYSDNTISDRIAFDLNPEYFLNGKNNQKQFTLQYIGTIDKRDIKPFPLNGYLLSLDVKKEGLGISDDVNSLTTKFKYANYHSFNAKYSLESILILKTNLLRGKQPYTHLNSMGYGEDTMNGYELYVIDGQDFGMLKTSFRYAFLEKNFQLGKLMPIKRMREMPVKAYFSVNNDIGFVHTSFYDHYGDLDNQFLWGGGIGLNLVMFYDKVFLIEYSMNQLGEKGVFLDFSLTF